MNISPCRDTRIHDLCASLQGLTDGQVGWVEKVINQFRKSTDFKRLKSSDLVTESLLMDFGDVLRIHHCFSKEAFTKDKFEYALEHIVNMCGIDAKLAPRGHRGHDIKINDVRFSLKTQANKSIQVSKIHISKFMELGKGQWNDQESDLAGLREQFFNHMMLYDRILTLRRLKTKHEWLWRYELVEIPKTILEESKNGVFRICTGSKQNPKPGYCDVLDENSACRFQLYFDGGSERKLQIKSLNKSLCIVHAEWIFETNPQQSVP